jgi:hypothetical protein
MCELYVNGDTAWLKSKWVPRCRLNVELPRGTLKVGDCRVTEECAGTTVLPPFLLAGTVLAVVPLLAFSGTELPAKSAGQRE